ncbi:ATP-binding protein [Streptomyces sp. NPDC056160]|uniref:ATP-binding protein n=1 Tax=Streptomyces sp. NPDC056160 TaxID=3345731 RepID=UPI0035D7AF21
MIPSPPLGTDAAAGLLAPGAATGAGPTGAVAERRFRFELAAHPGSPAQARRLTRGRLTGWSVCEDTCDTAALVVSELVTNAIVHTASNQIVCELLDSDDLVRISVRDEGCAPGEPHPSPQRPEEEHGRGLLLVEAMCRAWGAQEQGPGLVVWAELPRAADPADAGTATPGTQGFPEPGPGAASDPYVVRDDLGWGARPKPAPARHPGREDDPRAAREAQAPHEVSEARQAHAPREAREVPVHDVPEAQAVHEVHEVRTGTHAPRLPQSPHIPHVPHPHNHSAHQPSHGPQAPHGPHGPHAAQTLHSPHTPQGTRPQEPHGTGAVWL